MASSETASASRGWASEGAAVEPARVDTPRRCAARGDVAPRGNRARGPSVAPPPHGTRDSETPPTPPPRRRTRTTCARRRGNASPARSPRPTCDTPRARARARRRRTSPEAWRAPTAREARAGVESGSTDRFFNGSGARGRSARGTPGRRSRDTIGGCTSSPPRALSAAPQSVARTFRVHLSRDVVFGVSRGRDRGRRSRGSLFARARACRVVPRR